MLAGLEQKLDGLDVGHLRARIRWSWLKGWMDRKSSTVARSIEEPSPELVVRLG